MDLNSPLVLGAFISWLLSRSKGSEATRKARIDKGTLVASGFIAGGALVGVFTAFLKFLEDQWQVVLIPDLAAMPGLGAWLGAWGNWNGLALFCILGAWLYWNSWKAKAEE